MADVVDHPGEGYVRRRQSLLPRDADAMMSGPSIRRMSRLDARPSVQYGMSGRRMSHVSRSSLSGASFGMKDFKLPQQLQNTYRMAPPPNEKFQSKKAEDVIQQVLASYLGGEKYSPEICKSMITQISEVITGRIKDLGFRYKFVCVVTIGQNRNQGVAVASRSIWNTETDNYATASYSSGDVFAVACVYATYFE